MKEIEGFMESNIDLEARIKRLFVEVVEQKVILNRMRGIYKTTIKLKKCYGEDGTFRYKMGNIYIRMQVQIAITLIENCVKGYKARYWETDEDGPLLHFLTLEPK